jgi:hypothetical protein
LSPHVYTCDAGVGFFGVARKTYAGYSSFRKTYAEGRMRFDARAYEPEIVDVPLQVTGR